MPKRSWTIGALGLSAAALLSCSGEVTYLDGAAGNAGTGQVKEYSCQDYIVTGTNDGMGQGYWKDRVCICEKDPSRRDPNFRDISSCSTESVSGGFCCKDEYGCSCSHWGCRDMDPTCFCDSSLMQIYRPTQCTKLWAHCCLNKDYNAVDVLNCSCSNEPCSDPSLEVPSCGPEVATCPTGQEKVERCQ